MPNSNIPAEYGRKPSAWKRGYEDCMCDVPEDENPYGEGTPAGEQWDEGWSQADYEKEVEADTGGD